MALQIISGDISINKKTVIIKRLYQILKLDPKAKIFYLVPEHIKFDMETQLLESLQTIEASDHAASLDIQVVSFKRLAWFLLNKARPKKTHLSDIGTAMLIQQVVKAHENQLQVYRGQGRHLGFIEKLQSLFQELTMGNVDPDSFEAVLQTQDMDKAKLTTFDLETQRIKELALLYKAYVEALREGGFDLQQDHHDLLAFLQATGDLPHHYLVIDHHYFFNGQEYQLIHAMARTFNTVWVVLPIKDQISQGNFQPISQLVTDTYHQLKNNSKILGYDLMDDWQVTGPSYPYQGAILQAAHTYYDLQDPMTKVKSPEADQELPRPIHLWQFDSPQEELWHLSNQINHLVSWEGYRYSDILVLSRDMDGYQQFIDPYFSQNQIPYFYDHESTMGQSPLVLWLNGLLKLKLTAWSHQELMQVIKSDLFIPPWLQGQMTEVRHQKALLENVLLANGYFSYRFYNDRFVWQFPQMELPYQDALGQEKDLSQGDLLKQWRDWMITSLYQPLKAWDKVMSGSQAASWLYQLLVQTGIQGVMTGLRDQAIDQGHIALSRRLEQTWQTLMDVLDEIHKVYQDQTIDYQDFTDLILTGLGKATYHIIPPTLDQVTFASMESPQVKPRKICFIIGLNHTVLPRTRQLDSLLTSENRQHMQDQLLAHQYLKDQAKQSNLLEPIMVYQMLLTATDQVYLSYGVNVRGQQVNLAHPISQWADQIGLKMTYFPAYQSAFESDQIKQNQLGKPAMLVSPLLRVLKKNYLASILPNRPTLALVLQLKKAVPGFDQLLKGMFVLQHLPENLLPQTALALFGRDLYASVSKIESFYQDPFSHYLTYGLRIKERELYSLDAAKSGDYYHEALDLILSAMIADQVQLSQLDAKQLASYLDKVLAQLAQSPRFNLFDSHPRMQAIKGQMDAQLARFLNFASLQARQVQSQPLATEAIFGLGHKGGLKGFSYPLASGGKLTLTGKIDRIDQIDRVNGLQVIDYKSGNKQFDLVDLYYGHDLQIATYLKVAMANYPALSPLGAFYQPLSQAYQNASPAILDQLDRPDQKDYLLGGNLLRGFITMGPEELSKADPQLETQGQSLLYPARLKKSGDYYDAVPYLDPSILSDLMTFIDGKFIQAGQEIQAGNIKLAPYKDDPYAPSLQAGYRVISGFDATEHYHLYRHKTKSSKDFLKELSQGKED